jgi:branched-chain amino acid aminotransferase
VNGKLTEADAAAVSVFDHGFTVADGVFETLKFTSGNAFAIDRHLVRLINSAKGLGIAYPAPELIKTAIAEVSSANKHISNGRMRITVTSGSGPLGSDRSSAEPTLVISVAEQKTWGESSSVLLVPWIRNEKSPLTGLKTTSYAENVYALDIAQQNGFSEAIFLSSSGLVSEGTGSNIFLVKNGDVFSPDINSGLLPGITRDLVLEWSPKGVKVGDLTEHDLFDADELFLTSSTRDVHPITRIAKLNQDGSMGHDKRLEIGNVTTEIQTVFQFKSRELPNP